MFFLNPTYLWALAGLLIPIAIHFWSKKEGKTIKVGSTKLLSESDSKQSRSIKLNELLLLVLRILSIGILALLIAGVHLKKKASTTPITYIIEPSLVGDDRIRTIIDTIESEESLRLLQSGFPEFDEGQVDLENNDTPNYWQLAKEMETLPTDSIIVFTKSLIKGIKGKRPEISGRINWLSLGSDASVSKNLKVIKEKDTIHVLSMTSNPYLLSFNKEQIPINDKRIQLSTTNDSLTLNLNKKQEIVKPIYLDPKKVLLFYEDSLVDQKTYIEASLRAISTYINRDIDVEIRTQLEGIDFERFDLVIWLSTNPVPETSTKILAFRPDRFANSLITIGSTDRVFYLTEPLSIERSIDQNVSEQILKLLDFHKDIEEKIYEYDHSVMDISELQPLVAGLSEQKKPFDHYDISKWLWLLLGILFVVERSISKYRKQ